MTSYWDKRKHLAYYQEVERMILLYSPGSSRLDVGCADTPIVLIGNFSERYTVDLHTDPKLPGVVSYVEDFRSWRSPKIGEGFYLTTCLQTIEHLKDQEILPFVHKLFKISRNLIISVPYKWERSWTKTHYQDPIDLAKFLALMPRHPDQVEIVMDNGRGRIVARFDEHRR